MIFSSFFTLLAEVASSSAIDTSSKICRLAEDTATMSASPLWLFSMSEPSLATTPLPC
ncbi:hypothetical protein Syun_019299 [Stephania yunnanensis]|uniref:Secreted protein n=1 Tax=Stephania yunnanensis TaxID=152371 RepID=A0AAP0IVU4_9MAGN